MIEYRSFRAPHVLTDELRRFLHSREGQDFKTLSSLFPPQWKLVVMGGLLRDFFLDRSLNIETKPPDMDIVIFGAASIGEIREKLGKTSQRTNSFGGAKCRLRVKGLIFDLWRVEDHANMASERRPHTIEQLLKHNLLDVDALLWDPATDRLHNYGALEALAAGRIGLAGRQGISGKYAAAQLAHVLAVSYKTNFPLSEDARIFVLETSRQCPEADIEAILERKMPHAAVQIEGFWKDILRGGAQECPTQVKAIIPQTQRLKKNSSSLNTRR